MTIYKLLKPSFILWHFILLYVFFTMVQYNFLNLLVLTNNIPSILLFFSIYFLNNINRVIRFPYIDLIKPKSILLLYIKTLGFIYFIILCICFMINLDVKLFLLKILALTILIIAGSFTQIKVNNYWGRFFTLTLLCILIIGIL